MKNFEKLNAAAINLRSKIENLDAKDRYLAEAIEILRPILDVCLSSKYSLLPPRLPNQHFFYGMHDDCLPAWHLVDQADFLNAIGEFDEELKRLSAQTSK